ncbi:Na+/H+ antiporter subunit A [Brachybacterium sp. EF45031]|uniref:Na+/H+ antiporter subunit A n=1 Tax=Brachybacterium sillae TaxID=2810536 RepID=UPI00217D40BA|nr:Na+/H+ antiporter subunit A [Brachybacterium sillae]MCS6712205.1 Na+/H+ antiporter subunit A [Brachybacterium sillae]
MLTLLLAHAVAALIAPWLVRRIGRHAFYPLALVPLAGAVWTAAHDPRVLAEHPLTRTIPWLPQFDLSITVRMDPLSWVMTLLVCGVGALVLAYSARYFHDGEPGLGRFAGVLTAFAGAMAALVLADDVMVLFIAWELTTIFSYLLIGHYAGKQASRRAAMNALISTTAGGLAMFVGLQMLAVRAGSARFSDILASGMWEQGGPYLVTAMLLVIAGAASKSALIPTHFWLPGAMAAPTPVSAYLHAAAMVKAGIYLLLRFAPVFAQMPRVAAVVAVLGAATMLLGGWRSLRQTDLKLLLAFGTVSQLGFLAAVAALGTRGTTLAAMGMMLAHALFKAPLFMVVGIIDKTFGTRDLRRLSGVWRVIPVPAVIGILSAASMAAVPPLFGFVAKEGVYTSLWEAGGWHRVLLAALVVGSVLTVAYSWRFVRGAFLDSPGAPAVPAAAVPVLFWVPPALIAVGTLVLPFLATGVEGILHAQVEDLPQVGEETHLALVPHLGVPLLLSALTFGFGVLLAVAARPMERLQAAVSPDRFREGPLGDLVDAERGFRRLMREVDRVAVEVTPVFQRGSLPLTLGTMLLVLIALTVPTTLGALPVDNRLVLFHHPAEPLLFALATLGAIGAARSRRRLRAVFLITVTGYVAAMFFLLAGAPDVATTQVLVETASTVVLVLVLRRLPVHFSRRPLKLDRWVRWAIALGTAVAMCSAALLAAGARVAQPLGPELIEPAYTIGGGHNVVNVALVDARVWDTMGEISVLLVVATGVASLIFVTRREPRIDRVKDLDETATIWRRRDAGDLPRNVLAFDVDGGEPGQNRWRTWLTAGQTLAPERRMVMLEVVTRITFPLTMIFSLYLLMAGHNLPGGGFAGGLVAGLALTLRYLAGGRYELIEAAPVQAGLVLGTGLSIAVLTGVVPVLLGGGVFQSYQVTLHLPALGEVHLVSALIFDIGVYLVVVGVMLDFLRALGAQIDLQQEADADVR